MMKNRIPLALIYLPRNLFRRDFGKLSVFRQLSVISNCFSLSWFYFCLFTQIVIIEIVILSVVIGPAVSIAN